MNKHLKPRISFFLILASCLQLAVAQSQSAEDRVRKLYDAISFEPNNLPDWENVSTMFLPEAVITLRTSREAVSIFTVEEWIQDFVDFIENSELEGVGFNENIANLKVLEFGDMAHVLVLYEPRIPGKESKYQGVDSIHLIKRSGEWKIVSIVNEIPTSERPVPDVLR